MSDPTRRTDDPPGVFLFTDIEDSTVLSEQRPEAMRAATAELDGLISSVAAEHGGRVVKRVGDGMDLVFGSVDQAVRAAVAAQRAIGEVSWEGVGRLRVRMAIDVGVAFERDGALFGPALNRLGRLLAAAHGGQILASAEAASSMDGAEVEVRDLGEFRFKGLGRPQPVFQVWAEGLDREFPALRVTGGDPAMAAGEQAPTVRGYELRELLGSGPLGSVYRAWQTAVGREVAVKVIDWEVANGPRFVRRFESAAQSVARLEHPHLVGLFDFWRDPEGAYLVMPFLRGGSVAVALERGPWRVPAARRLVEQVGAGLSYVHRNGLVHGAVRPSNVLLDADGNAHLADLTVASHRREGSGEPPAEVAVFVAPEHRRGGSSRAGDVYSLGALVRELLTGGASQVRLPEDLGAVLEAATAERPEGRPASMDDLVTAVSDLLSDAADQRRRPTSDQVVRNPYKGLRAFTEADAADFFGRETLVTELVEALGQRRLVAVFGPSGSGKSSLVRAGLVPALRTGAVEGSADWLVTDLLPGTHPFEELEAALLRVAVEDPGGLVEELRRDERGLARVVKRILPGDGSELVLIIDQFEELFTLVEEAAVRELLLAQFAAVASDERSRVRVVLTMRADFADRALEHPGFAELFKAAMVPVIPPTEAELERAIAEPARAVGLELEKGLVEAIVADVRGQPGSLPLLQHDLNELFRRREGGRLTLAAYRASGGVIGALARTAEETYGDIRPAAQTAARQVFLRLVALGEGTEDTRRRVTRSELLSLPDQDAAIEEAIEAFGERRLLSFDRDSTTREPTVEVAHEALLRHWDRLRRWIADSRDDLRQHRGLRQAAADWRESDRDASYLLPPARIDEVDGWLREADVALTGQEIAYLDASRERKEELQAAEAERVAHEEALERRAIARMRAVIAVLVVGLLVAGGLTAFAFQQRGAAEQQRVAAEAERATAERAERVATARGLASAATAQLEDDPELATLLGIAAIATTRGVDGDVLPEAETALRRALRQSHLSHRLEIDGGFGSVIVSPDGDRVAALGMEGTLMIWDAETWDAVLELDGMSHTDLVFYDDIAFTPDGSSIVVSDDELRGALRDISTGEVSVEFEGMLARPQISPDGRVIAGVSRREVDAFMEQDPTIGLWDAATGELLRTFDVEGTAIELAFSPDSRQIAIAGGRAHVWDVETGEELWSTSDQGYWVVDFHPDGEMLVVSGGLVNVDVLQADDGTLLYSFLGHEVPVQAAAFSRDGGRLATGDQQGVTRIWNVETRREALTLAGHAGPLADVVFMPGGEQVATASRDGTVRIWDVSGVAGHEYAAVPAPVPPIAGNSRFGPDGRFLATPGMDGARIWEIDTMEETAFFPHEQPVSLVAFSQDGRLVATATVDGYPEDPISSWMDQVHLWDVRSGDRLWTTEDETHYSDLVFSPDGSQLAAVGRDAARVFEVATGEIVFSHPVGAQGLRGLYVLDGEGLVVSGAEETALLDATTGDRIRTLFEGSMTGVALVDQETVFIVDGPSANVLEVDVRTGDEVRVVRDEPPGPSIRIEVRDGVLYISRGEVLTARDLETGDRRFDLDLAPAMWSFDVSPDDRYLVTNHVHPWTFLYVTQTDDLLDLAHERLTRWWTEEECEEFLQGPCPERPSA